MSKPRFLLDECVNKNLVAALIKIAPSMDVLQMGLPGAPPKGTKDPELLIAAESLGRVVVTNDKRTMPGHLRKHYAAGHHSAGVMLIRRRAALARYVQSIVNYWNTTEGVDWIDRMVYIP